MLDAETNKMLTEVSKGTPMGELLRRYWHPIAAVSEFETQDLKPVRLLGEDLVLFHSRDGLVQRQCAHRRADLSYGWVDEAGLRCSYHGWAYDVAGACVAQPYEDVTRALRGCHTR